MYYSEYNNEKINSDNYKDLYELKEDSLNYCRKYIAISFKLDSICDIYKSSREAKQKNKELLDLIKE